MDDADISDNIPPQEPIYFALQLLYVIRTSNEHVPQYLYHYDDELISFPAIHSSPLTCYAADLTCATKFPFFFFLLNNNRMTEYWWYHANTKYERNKADSISQEVFLVTPAGSTNIWEFSGKRAPLWKRYKYFFRVYHI